MVATMKASSASSRRSTCSGSAATSNRRVSANVVGGRLPPGLQTVEDFRVTSHSMQDLAQPQLPPALRSMEAFKTRRSFLTGKCGFDSSQCSPDLSSAIDGSEWQDPISLSLSKAERSSASEDDGVSAMDSLTFDLLLGDDTDDEGDIY
eukprot:NODE_1169_length_1064_cov_348.619704_g893_i0.p2 GENE.NODE_1169_length_1064_cov_348.619704_g893_i0~~NODE_1169_length_1064_cov_348.619704_g893_i0.p2  ORF type:complete len:149 (+),score=24.75 NODE_1169_length_1064_cov_348.619704_g893_i0:175-621(+)